MTRLDFLKRAELALAVLLTTTALFLLVIRATHAGALWRDECGTVQLAMMPKVSDIMDYFDHQTFPPLVPLIVRGYIQLFGDSDVALRGFGLVAGITYIGAAWWAAQVAGQGVPLMPIGLFGLSPLFLRSGTTVGGYGFGAVLIVIAFAATVKLLQRRKPRAILLVFLAALVSQQLVINNLILVLTIVLSALVIALGHRKSKTAGILVLIAVGATLLGTIYLRIFANDEWRILFQHPSHIPDLWSELTQAYGQGWLITWVARAAFLIIAFTGAWVSFRNPWDDDGVVIPRFALLVMLVSPLAYFGALLTVGYRTHWWHYLLLLALLPVLMDTMVIAMPRVYWLRLARLGLASTAAILITVPAWTAAHQRQTNIDTVAAKLTEQAKPHDLIVVAPWQLGISFNHYYHGKTTWMTLPEITDHQIHRYDLLLAKMISPNPIEDLLEAISHTLASGNRIWFVGELRLPEPGRPPLSLPPAPNKLYGWDDSAYSESWLEHVGTFLRSHTYRARPVALPAVDATSSYEDIPLTMLEGWQ
ncbi:MAG: hypothetical protein DME33_12905 [Verrucomicrobia bacterium]|nr:MAG: hypothetical protein DME33_12905 [Verrucomicrobiota bacterium]